MEMATILYMAESERKKGTGMILKKREEELIFIAESSYPIWLIPWRERILLFDGMGITRDILAYDVLPDVKKFVNDIEGCTEKLEAYSAALVDRAHYFQSVSEVEEKTILGLITSPNFVEDFSVYLAESEESEESEIKAVRLSTVVDESSIASSLNELSELKTVLENDIENLRYSMKLLNDTTRKHVGVIREVIREIQRDFNEKIATEKSLATEKVREIQEGYDARITKTSKRFEQQLQQLHQERVKLEKAEERALAQIDRCKVEIEAAKQRKDQAVQQKWKQEMENWKREAKALRESLEELNKRIEDTESEKKVEISNLRSEFNVQAENAMKNVRELEASRDSQVQLNQKKIKSLEDSTSNIIAQLDNLARRKSASLHELGKMGMQDNRRKPALVHVPFYLVCFQAEAKHRYMVYSPAVAGMMGVLTKFKGVFGVSRVRSLFQQRSRAVTTVLNQLVALAERDPVFERGLYDAGVKANILQTEETRERVKTGLEELKREGWISDSEFQTFGALLTHK